jgi:hypothetical protein
MSSDLRHKTSIKEEETSRRMLEIKIILNLDSKGMLIPLKTSNYHNKENSRRMT